MTQFRMFDAKAGTPQAVRFTWTREEVEDDCCDTSYLDADSGRYDDVEDDEERARYEAEDAARLADYGDGWTMIGIRARLDIAVPMGGGSFATYSMESPGLYGIESDSGEGYLAEVFEEEKAQLWDSLRKIGLTVLAFDALGGAQ